MRYEIIITGRILKNIYHSQSCKAFLKNEPHANAWFAK